MYSYIINYTNGTSEEKTFSECFSAKENYFTLPRDLVNSDTVDSVDILLCGDIPSGTSGYYAISGAWWNAKVLDCGMGYFKEHEDTEYIHYDPHLPIFCVAIDRCGYLYIADGMKDFASPKIVVKDGLYSFYFHYEFNKESVYEDIKILRCILDGDISYSAMGRKYRDYCFANGYIKIKDRLNEELRYAAESIMVRVRFAWKPVPSIIKEQTEENEPPVHVACTFADIEKLMYDYKEAGVEKAEFCLVGWNKSGHDGRWPQMFPPEEKIGGEDGLKSLVNTAKILGYKICCHTNSTDGYSIANNFTFDDVMIDQNGELIIKSRIWSGGNSYAVCPKRALEFAEEDFPKLAEYGFRGTHYIDVITAKPTSSCNSEKHPVNRREYVQYMDKILKLAKFFFGCAGSECSFEHSLKNCDYVLYNTFRTSLKSARQDDELDLIDRYIPLWQIIFHGTVLSCPSASAVNAVINDDPDAMLKTIEYGGRPAIYYYSRFKTDGNDWIGAKDFTLNTPEDTAMTIEAAKKTYDIYKELAYLQYELMEKHEEISENVFETTYSDGSVIMVDYNTKQYTLKKA